jgi:hypothetical protein
MANATISQLGVDNLTTDGSWDQDNALFMKEAMPEILNAFDENNIFKALHRTRSITKGKSAAFHATGQASARYHTPGTPVLGSNQIPQTEVIIKVDDLLLSDVFIYDLDDAKAHIDVRQEYTHQLGQSLADAYDQKLARVVALTARSSAIVSGGNGGSRIENASMASSATVLGDSLFTAAQTFDENKVPAPDRHAVLRPAQFYLMVKAKDYMNTDWGGAGSLAKATLPEVAGIALHKSNNIPSTNITAAVDGENNDYTGDFRTTVGLVFNRMAVGTVELRALTTQMTGSDFNVMYQGDLMLAKMAVGHGMLRPDCAIELASGVIV